MSRPNVFGTACKTCRRRGRKCDRSLPTCTSCRQRGVNCEGYKLRWISHNGTASDLTGTRRGMSKAGQAEAGTVESSLYAAGHRAKVELYSDIAVHTSSGAQETNREAIVVLRQQNWSLSNITGTTGDNLDDLIDYYRRELSAAFYLGLGSVETPYSCHILPMTQSIAFVRHAVAALASCHIANRLDDDQLKSQSLHLRLRAIELLREDLKERAAGPDLPGLACMLLLAQLDLCSGDCVEFGIHLEAASRFVISCGSDETERGFFEQRLAWLDIMGSTTTSRMPHWTSKEIKATMNKFRTSSGREWGFDVFACPINLVESIADITVLYKLQPNKLHLSQNIIQEAMLLGNAVKKWDASIYIDDPRSHIVEVWRLGILLYLTRLFRFHNDIFNTRDLLDRIFSHARAIPVRISWNVSTTWPLFQAGLLLSHEDDKSKAWLRNELVTNFQNLGCYNLNRAVGVLEEVWQMGEDQSHHFFTFELLQRRLVV